jgi:hypothetical protein
MPRQGLGLSISKNSTVFLKKDGAYTYGYFTNNNIAAPLNFELAYKTKDSNKLWCLYDNVGAAKLAHGKWDDGSGVRYVFNNGLKGDVAKHDDGPFSYGYYSNGEIDIKITSTHVDIDTNTKRYYVNGLPANGSYIDDLKENNYPYNFINGIKGHITADTLLKENLNSYISINSKDFKNGIYSIFADGNGSEYKVFCYYPKGDVITQDLYYSYISDGIGGKYEIHNSGAFKKGYFKDGKLHTPADTQCVYNVLDEDGSFGVYNDSGEFINYANNISKSEDGKYYNFYNGKKDNAINGAIENTQHLSYLLNTPQDYNIYLEFDNGVYCGLANGYFTNGCYTDGYYDYHKPSYVPILPKDSNETDIHYVYYWCGLPFHSRLADGPYTQGYYDNGAIN